MSSINGVITNLIACMLLHIIDGKYCGPHLWTICMAENCVHSRFQGCKAGIYQSGRECTICSTFTSNIVSLINQLHVRQKSVHMAIFRQCSAFISVNVTVSFAQILHQVWHRIYKVSMNLGCNCQERCKQDPFAEHTETLIQNVKGD